jgi:hypothetical protein
MLALILIGTDVSLEPYRAEDRRELEEVLEAAALAFAHSTAFERLLRAESALRELFDTMRRVEDATESIHTYWKRVYRKTGQRGRAAVRGWTESLLAREFGGST